MKRERITYVRLVRETIRMTRQRSGAEISCHVCGAPMTLAQYWAEESRLSLREIFRQVERAEIHFSEAGDNQLFVCTGRNV